MAKFRKKPVVIDALQWSGTNNDEMVAFLGDFKGWSIRDFRFAIKTLEGVMWASEGDWIIKGVKGEFYPCRPDIFKATYEPLEYSPTNVFPERSLP